MSMKRTKHNYGHRWTTEELRELASLWSEGAPAKEIAAHLGTTAEAVQKMVVRLRQQGVPLERRTSGNAAGRRFKPWTQDEVAYLVRRRAEKATAEAIGNELGRTINGVRAMILRLRQEDVPVAMLGSGVRRLWDPTALKLMMLDHPDREVIERDAAAAKLVRERGAPDA